MSQNRRTNMQCTTVSPTGSITSYVHSWLKVTYRRTQCIPNCNHDAEPGSHATPRWAVAEYSKIIAVAVAALDVTTVDKCCAVSVVKVRCRCARLWQRNWTVSFLTGCTLHVWLNKLYLNWHSLTRLNLSSRQEDLRFAASVLSSLSDTKQNRELPTKSRRLLLCWQDL